MAAHHVCRSPGLVNEDEARRIETELAVEPFAAAASGCRDGLVPRHARSFLRVMLWRKEPLDRAEAEEQTLFGNAMPDLFDRRIAVWPQGFEDGVPMGIDPAERRSPSKARGRASPCWRSRLRLRLMLAALTSKRSAAARCDKP